MFKIIYDTSGADQELQRILQQVIPDAVKATLDKSAQSGRQGAKEIVHVISGDLKDSIRVLEQGDNYIVIGSDLDYAADEEFGNSKRPPHPYLSPQGDRLQSEAPRTLEEEINRRL
jgi:phage gpG-like protein